ncbi:MAG: MarR family winged helix-turn-helix transcriptional regulator [Hyphomicrobiaceae bacterium]|jgi:DNA-binding MarR family transcriptional regulator
MADINPEAPTLRPEPAASPGGPAGRDDLETRDATAFIELLFFAYRDFTGDADAMLGEFGFGRAHHRVLHFVNRHPGLRVADLLGILKITKQSLARVLKQLVDDGWITQRAGDQDRRERLLFPTERGTLLARRLVALQAKRVNAALAAAGHDTDAAVRRFLFAMISEDERAQVKVLLPDTGV